MGNAGIKIAYTTPDALLGHKDTYFYWIKGGTDDEKEFFGLCRRGISRLGLLFHEPAPNQSVR